jgi:hypothetical protein
MVPSERGCGLVSSDGRILLPFSSAWQIGEPSHGVCQVFYQNKLFLVYSNGTFKLLEDINPASTFWIPPFTDGISPANSKEGLVGYIDSTGSWVIPPRFGSALNFVDGYALTTDQDGEAAIIDRNGAKLATFADIYFGKHWSWPRNPWCFEARNCAKEGVGCLVIDGKDIIEFPGSDALGRASEGLVSYRIGYEMDDPYEYQLRTLRNEPVSDARFSSLLEFSCGLAIAGDSQDKRGAIDRRGRWVIPPIYDQLDPFVQGFAVAEKDGKQSLIDRRGQTVFDFKGARGFIDSFGVWAMYPDATWLLDFKGNPRWKFDLSAHDPASFFDLLK